MHAMEGPFSLLVAMGCWIGIGIGIGIHLQLQGAGFLKYPTNYSAR